MNFKFYFIDIFSFLLLFIFTEKFNFYKKEKLSITNISIQKFCNNTFIAKTKQNDHFANNKPRLISSSFFFPEKAHHKKIIDLNRLKAVELYRISLKISVWHRYNEYLILH